MRKIDADALKEMICSHVYPVVDYFNSKDYGMFWTGGIEKIIDEQPTIEAEPHWIPCSERLPEINEHHVSDVCLVYIDDGAMMFSEMQENIFGQRFWECERDDDYHKSVGEVIAWMPLPKPYEVKDV